MKINSDLYCMSLRVWAICLFASASIQSCQPEIDVALPLNTAGSCRQELMIVGTLEQAEGKIISNTTVNPTIYNIELNAPQQVGQYQVRILNSCNLPDTLRKVGQSVIVSGRVLTYGEDVEIRMDIFGQPFDITTISSEQ